MMIRPAMQSDLPAVTRLAMQLWEDHAEDELLQEMHKIHASGDAQFFLAYEGDAPVGFAQCQLRHDYVEGTSHSPVGYLEGIFVLPACRRKGYARQLLSACEAWARSRGCREFASDCELSNTDSLAMHLGLGFAEANRIICFTKPL